MSKPRPPEKKRRSFAKEIVVTIENEGQGDDEYLQVNSTPHEAMEAQVKKRGGIYVLKEEVTIEAAAKVTVTKIEH